eukprot:2966130-Rhodomonas_salina.3
MVLAEAADLVWTAGERKLAGCAGARKHETKLRQKICRVGVITFPTWSVHHGRARATGARGVTPRGRGLKELGNQGGS